MLYPIAHLFNNHNYLPLSPKCGSSIDYGFLFEKTPLKKILLYIFYCIAGLSIGLGVMWIICGYLYNKISI